MGEAKRRKKRDPSWGKSRVKCHKPRKINDYVLRAIEANDISLTFEPLYFSVFSVGKGDDAKYGLLLFGKEDMQIVMIRTTSEAKQRNASTPGVMTKGEAIAEYYGIPFKELSDQLSQELQKYIDETISA